jgi:hypothetical protein
MNKYQLYSSFLVSLLLSIFGECHIAHGASFSLLPGSSSLTSGNPLIVDIQVSDLSETEALAGFDLSVNFDENFLRFSNFSFGDLVLGDLVDLSDFQIQDVQSSFGSVTVSQVSLDDSMDLILTQPASFILGRLSLSPIASGDSSLSLVVNAVIEANNTSLGIDIINNASVVISSSSTVPESSTTAALFVFSCGLGLLKGIKL